MSFPPHSGSTVQCSYIRDQHEQSPKCTPPPPRTYQLCGDSHLPDDMYNHRRRRWANIKPTLAQRLCFQADKRSCANAGLLLVQNRCLEAGEAS